MREPRDYEAPLCAEIGGDYWFSDKPEEGYYSLNDVRYAQSICHRCRHRNECAEWGIQEEHFGIWGGLTTIDRQRIRRQRRVRDEGIA